MKVKFKQPLALFVIFCLCLTMVLPVSAANTYNSELFTDIAGHWAEKEIARAIEAGYVSGMSATTFSPDLPMTVLILLR